MRKRDAMQNEGYISNKGIRILFICFNMRNFILLIFLISQVFMFSQQKTGTKNGKVYLTTDDRELYVYFPGGKDGITSDSLLLHYITEYLIYPDSAYKAKIEGKVYVSFAIGTDGEISDIRILKGSNPYFDKEVIRLVSSMPNWVWDARIKETDRRKTTRTLPINFCLKADSH